MNTNRDTDTKASRPTTAAVRDWARRNGIAVSDRGRIPTSVYEEYESALTVSALEPWPPAPHRSPAHPAVRAAALRQDIAPIPDDVSPLRVSAIADTIDAHARCDVCSARAYVLTGHEAGTLAWCKHHAEQIAIPSGARIVADTRATLLAA